MSESLSSRIAAQRCQRARHAEWADTLPALYRSEGFFEDLASDEALPAPRLGRPAGPLPRPVWANGFNFALALRRA